jgi:multisubunit Na+/H+ antiporter MnhB subunit
MGGASKKKETKLKADLSFVQIAFIQFAVFASAVFAFLLSMAWNNVVQAYTYDDKDNQEQRQRTLIIYAVVITVVAIILMTLIAYVTSRQTEIPVSKIIG